MRTMTMTTAETTPIWIGVAELTTIAMMMILILTTTTMATSTIAMKTTGASRDHQTRGEAEVTARIEDRTLQTKEDETSGVIGGRMIEVSLTDIDMARSLIGR